MIHLTALRAICPYVTCVQIRPGAIFRLGKCQLVVSPTEHGVMALWKQVLAERVRGLVLLAKVSALERCLVRFTTVSSCLFLACEVDLPPPAPWRSLLLVYGKS